MEEQFRTAMPFERSTDAATVCQENDHGGSKKIEIGSGLQRKTLLYVISEVCREYPKDFGPSVALRGGRETEQELWVAFLNARQTFLLWGAFRQAFCSGL